MGIAIILYETRSSNLGQLRGITILWAIVHHVARAVHNVRIVQQYTVMYYSPRGLSERCSKSTMATREGDESDESES
jgi:hypothetical protein